MSCEKTRSIAFAVFDMVAVADSCGGTVTGRRAMYNSVLPDQASYSPHAKLHFMCLPFLGLDDSMPSLYTNDEVHLGPHTLKFRDS